MRVVRLLTVLGAGAVAAALLGGRLDGIGTRGADRTAVLPGDDLTGRDALVRTRAVTIAAPAAEVWPWLVQLGWGRAGWYSVDAVERLVGAARSVDGRGRVSWRSLDEIVPAHQDLAVGDTVPLHRDLGFTVEVLDEPLNLVLRTTSGGLDMVWAAVLRDAGLGCRLVVRTTMEATGPVRRAAVRLLLDPGHALMELAQLRGIRERAEGRRTT